MERSNTVSESLNVNEKRDYLEFIFSQIRRVNTSKTDNQFKLNFFKQSSQMMLF